MNQTEQLDKLLAEYGGVIQTAQVMKHGISKPVFYDYIRKRKLERVARGIYAKSDAWVDPLYLIHLRCRQGIFSHETALFLHELTDREPTAYSLTVRTGYNPSRLTADGIQVYTIKQDLYPVGREEITTSFGNEVPVYNMERTICDIIRSRKNIEIQTFQDALKQYSARKEKNLHQLMKVAKVFRVEKILRQSLEVLL